MGTLKIVGSGVLWMISLSTSTASTPVTCKGGTFPLGQPFTVSFYFHSNLSAVRPGINVVRYPLDNSSLFKETDVLQCVWPVDAVKPTCVVEGGYEYDDTIDDCLTLKISAATDTVSGLYMCHVIPQGDFQPHACEVSITGVIPVPSSTNKPSTTSDSNDGEYSEKSDNDIGKTAMIVVLCLVFILVLSAFLYWIFRRRNLNCSGRLYRLGETDEKPEEERALIWHESDEELNPFLAVSADVVIGFSYPLQTEKGDRKRERFINRNCIRLPGSQRNSGWDLNTDEIRATLRKSTRLQRVLNPTRKI